MAQVQMHDIITPEPHFIPGYSGHVPQWKFRVGRTFGKQSHKLLIDPCIVHSKIPIVNEIHTLMNTTFPSRAQTEILNDRRLSIDAVYDFPILPGYDGYLPNFINQIGKRFNAAAIDGLCQYEQLMKLQRCDRRNLEHGDLLKSGNGIFRPKKGERCLDTSLYRKPLIPVSPKASKQGADSLPYIPPAEIYSKYKTPHFLECDDEDKYIKTNYDGHVPQIRKLIGLSTQPLTRNGLCDFQHLLQDHIHQRHYPEWKEPRTDKCYMEGLIDIYPKETGIMPSYAGHVPGLLFKSGKTFGKATTNAKKRFENIMVYK